MRWCYWESLGLVIPEVWWIISQTIQLSFANFVCLFSLAKISCWSISLKTYHSGKLRLQDCKFGQFSKTLSQKGWGGSSVQKSGFNSWYWKQYCYSLQAKELQLIRKLVPGWGSQTVGPKGKKKSGRDYREDVRWWLGLLAIPGIAVAKQFRAHQGQRLVELVVTDRERLLGDVTGYCTDHQLQSFLGFYCCIQRTGQLVNVEV